MVWIHWLKYHRPINEEGKRNFNGVCRILISFFHTYWREDL